MFVQTHTKTHSHTRISGTLQYMCTLIYHVCTHTHPHTLTHTRLRHTACKYMYTLAYNVCTFTHSHTLTHTHTHSHTRISGTLPPGSMPFIPLPQQYTSSAPLAGRAYEGGGRGGGTVESIEHNLIHTQNSPATMFLRKAFDVHGQHDMKVSCHEQLCDVNLVSYTTVQHEQILSTLTDGSGV